MARTEGSRNMVAFADQGFVATTSSKEVRHLARQDDSTALERFKATIRNQGNFLSWIDTRHHELLDAKARLNPEGRGPKDAIYRKYRWYAEQVTLLEAINAFEVFYKESFIGLATALRRYIPPERIKGSVDAKVLWTSQGKTSFTSLIFEHQLFHDLEQVDKVSGMLIDAKRYVPNNLKSKIRPRVVALQAVFQIRHTLSHNQGRVTQSDKSKFESLGYGIELNEVIDPTKDYLGRGIYDLLCEEAEEFTEWLLGATADFLKSRSENEDIELPGELKKRIEKFIGSSNAIDDIEWIDS